MAQNLCRQEVALCDPCASVVASVVQKAATPPDPHNINRHASQDSQTLAFIAVFIQIRPVLLAVNYYGETFLRLVVHV